MQNLLEQVSILNSLLQKDPAFENIRHKITGTGTALALSGVNSSLIDECIAKRQLNDTVAVVVSFVVVVVVMAIEDVPVGDDVDANAVNADVLVVIVVVVVSMTVVRVVIIQALWYKKLFCRSYLESKYI